MSLLKNFDFPKGNDDIDAFWLATQYARGNPKDTLKKQK